MNLSNNPALIQFECDSNSLTTLDFSKCQKLSDLHCDNNKLISIAEVNKSKLLQVQLYSLSGELIKTTSDVNMDLSELSSETYSVRIIAQNEVSIQKVIKL